MAKQTLKKARTAQKRLEQIRAISEGMRDIDPEGFDAAAASVRRNMASALKYTPHLFLRKH